MNTLRVTTTLPDSEQTATVVIPSEDAIGLRVGTKYCVAHPTWMTRQQLADLCLAVYDLMGQEDG